MPTLSNCRLGVRVIRMVGFWICSGGISVNSEFMAVVDTDDLYQ